MTWDEDAIEQAAIGWFKSLGFSYAFGPDIGPEGERPERAQWSQVILEGRLSRKIAELNPNVPAEAIEDAFRKVAVLDGPTLVARNRQFHKMLRDGVEVEYRRKDGSVAGDRVRLVDFDNLDNNDWLVVNQFTVLEGGNNRRPDIVVFLNGLPLAVLEIKRPPSALRIDNCRPIRIRFHHFLITMSSLSLPTVSRRRWAPSLQESNGSSPGRQRMALTTNQRGCLNLRP